MTPVDYYHLFGLFIGIYFFLVFLNVVKFSRDPEWHRKYKYTALFISMVISVNAIGDLFHLW
jgi:hypothetical protein